MENMLFFAMSCRRWSSGSGSFKRLEIWLFNMTPFMQLYPGRACAFSYRSVASSSQQTLRLNLLGGHQRQSDLWCHGRGNGADFKPHHPLCHIRGSLSPEDFYSRRSAQPITRQPLRRSVEIPLGSQEVLQSEYCQCV